MSEAGPILHLEGVRRVFAQAGERLEVLRGIDLAIRPGEMVALVGPSGSGKSTLLHLAGLLERPDEGEVRVAGEATSRLNDDRRTGLRRSTIGFVYQYHHLLPEFSALENVVIPQMIAGVARRKASTRAEELLTKVGLARRTSHRPAQLSGGEQQRVAIARALANAPRLLLADEPTGNLDHHHADEAFALLQDLVRAAGVGALIATHNLELAGRMDRTLVLDDGRVKAG
ncbi:MAG: lipoprotein-releasing system ATP-binding protein LolD 1 [Alphaproteobacteria bacterium]|nr:MAG: lipoprotein-releasing system ATP-binding protein LolD 1 [Alphaproteobacteria bacterium]